MDSQSQPALSLVTNLGCDCVSVVEACGSHRGGLRENHVEFSNKSITFRRSVGKVNYYMLHNTIKSALDLCAYAKAYYPDILVGVNLISSNSDPMTAESKLRSLRPQKVNDTDPCRRRRTSFAENFRYSAGTVVERL